MFILISFHPIPSFLFKIFEYSSLKFLRVIQSYKLKNKMDKGDKLSE